MGHKETPIQKAIVSYLELRGYPVFRMPLGAVLHSKKSKIFYKKHPLKGFPDLFFFRKGGLGMLGTIEVKSADGKLSDDQKDWRYLLKSQGVLYILAREIQIVKKALDEDEKYIREILTRS